VTGERAERPRILGLVEGDPDRALSAVARHLLDALDRRFPVVERVDYSPHGARKLALAAATFHPSHPTWRARFHTSRRAYLTLSRTLAAQLRSVEQEFDLAVQVHGWVGGQPRPYTVYVDQTRLMAERGWPQWLPLARRERDDVVELEREMYDGAFHLFVMAKPARESLLADYGIDQTRISVVGGGLRFAVPPPPRRPSPDPVILFVGREFERKGGPVLLRAFEQVRRELPDAVLHLVGAGERHAAPGVIAHGRLGDERDLARLYGAARVFCLPTLYEPYGLVYGEAMAHSVPCIGTATGAIPEILDQGRAGLMVPAGEPEPLAAALLRLLTDYELACSLGAAGRRWVEAELTWDRVAERMAPVLAGL
jgi:glycosyltransferase involved in cell wall biosynthesis